MNRSNLMFMLGLIGGTALGFIASGSIGGFGSGADLTPQPAEMDHSMHKMGGKTHDHDRVQEVDPSAVPAVQIALQSEGGCAYNLLLSLDNFKFSPETVNEAHISGTGHAHLYADDQKLGRIYSEWYHFTAPKGSKSIEVTLNSNDHATLSHEGKAITAKADLSDC